MAGPGSPAVGELAKAGVRRVGLGASIINGGFER
jgi:hypothetical protein